VGLYPNRRDGYVPGHDRTGSAVLVDGGDADGERAGVGEDVAERHAGLVPGRRVDDGVRRAVAPAHDVPEPGGGIYRGHVGRPEVERPGLAADAVLRAIDRRDRWDVVDGDGERLRVKESWRAAVGDADSDLACCRPIPGRPLEGTCDGVDGGTRR